LEVENGEKAIETINSGENRLMLDVMICDIRMPKVNGSRPSPTSDQLSRVRHRADWLPDTDMATSFPARRGRLSRRRSKEKLRLPGQGYEQRELARL
jgi:two-component system chemotaxis response regulator CheY